MTTTDTASLHMVQLRLDPRRLAALGKKMKLPLARTRTQYLVHCAFGKLFGDQAPKPFSIESGPSRTSSDASQNGREVRLLGYAADSEERLHALASSFAEPETYKICHWDHFASKPMPETFPEGMRLRFELQACPVVRKGSAGEGRNAQGEVRTWRKGQELDAFLSRQWANPDETFDRESVYRAWLARQFDIRGGAEVDADSVGMTRFSIERMTRRNGPNRTPGTVKRPDVTLTGLLTVTDGEAFAKLLASGIGRHKSFGYGMLKIRRA